MKTDSLFYQLFATTPALVFELIGETFPRASIYGFGSQEVKETSFRIDGILNPPPYASDLPIVFVEVQGYRDTKGIFYSSFFAEIYLYLHDYQPPNDWKAVMIFTHRRFDPGLPLHYREFGTSFRFQQVYLNELPDPLPGRSLEFGVMQLMGLKEDVLPDRAKQLVERTQQELTDVSAQRKILELVETVLIYRFPDLSSQEIATMLGISELKQTRVYQDALQEGRQEGIQEGEQRGKQAEALAFVTRLLTRRFGTIASEVQSQLQQLTSHQLEDLGEALLDFTSPEDLTTWLQSIHN